MAEDVAKLMVQLSARAFSKVGSPTFDANGDITVGPLHSRHVSKYLAANLGSYRTSAECKLAQLDHLMRAVREKSLGWDDQWYQGDPKYRTEPWSPVWAYIMLLEARDIIQSNAEMNEEKATYLRHGDDHSGQFIFNDDGTLAGVIDWEL
jgi:hypothetical protein